MEPSERAAAPSADRVERARFACLRVWALIGAVVVAAVAVAVIGRLSSVLLFLVVGCIISYVATPLVNWLERHRVPRGVGALVGVLFVALCVVLLFALIIPVFLGQMSELLRDLPAKISGIGQWFSGIEQSSEVVQALSRYVEVGSLVDSLQGILTKVVSALLSLIGDGLVPAVSNIASAFFVVFLGLVFAYWLTLDYPRISGEICTVLGERRSGDYRLLMAVLSRSVGGYLRTTVIDSLIQGTLAFVGFTLAGHPYAGIMGVLSGLLNFVPVVGPSISAIVATGVALLFSPTMAFWTMVAAVVAQNVTDNLIVPRINQSTMQIHPVLSLTAIVIGSALMGAVGMVVALPLCAVTKGLFVFYFETRSGRQVVSYDGALFRGTPYYDVDGRPVPACDALGDSRFAIESQIVSADEVPEGTAAPRPRRAWEKLWDRLTGRKGEKD